jgi:F-type H+-transporting ATPase subunit epsilon
MPGTIKLEVVTAEKLVYSEDVDIVVAPGIEGELGILPHHANLMTMLQAGELRIKRGSEELSMAISGGFLEVRPDRVIILADAAERESEINFQRAEDAKRRAEERLSRSIPGLDTVEAEAALRRSITRLKVADKMRKRRLGQ